MKFGITKPTAVKPPATPVRDFGARNVRPNGPNRPPDRPQPAPPSPPASGMPKGIKSILAQKPKTSVSSEPQNMGDIRQILKTRSLTPREESMMRKKGGKVSAAKKTKSSFKW